MENILGVWLLPFSFSFKSADWFCLKAGYYLDQTRWSSVAGIILKSSSSGSRIWQLRVNYSSNTTPLFFTSGTTDVSSGLMVISLTVLVECKGEGGSKEGTQNIGRAASLHYAPYVIFVECVSEFPAFSSGEVVLFWNLKWWSQRFCVLTPVLCPPLLPSPSPSHQIPRPGAETGNAQSISSWNVIPRELAKLLFYSTKPSQAVYILHLLFSRQPLLPSETADTENLICTNHIRFVSAVKKNCIILCWRMKMKVRMSCDSVTATG